MPDRRAYALKIARALIVAVIVVVGGAKAFGVWEARRARTLPAPTGPFAVGRRSFAWRDTTRADLLAPDPSSVRELFVWVWYPARATPDAVVADYLPPAWLAAVRRTPRGQRLDRVHSHSLDGAPAAGDSAYPLLVFSPGLGNMPTNYTALLEDVASHGYMVVAVAHPYSTTDIVFPDGHIVRDADSRQPLRLNRAVTVLAADLISVLDHVAHEHDRGDAFFVHADPQRAGAFGHSFGGASAAQALANDARFRAGVDIDGTIFGPVLRKGVAQPFLMLMADLDVAQRLISKPKFALISQRDARIGEDVFVSHSPRTSWLNISGWTHMNVADEGFYYAPQHRLAELFGMRRTGAETQRIASAYVRAFFERHLKGSESPAHELDRPSGDGRTWVRRSP